MSDLTQQIADIVWQYLTDVRKDGYTVDGIDGDHLANRITDHLIDLAGAGQLLAAINQIGRP